jgi:site-specific recombinase XerD
VQWGEAGNQSGGHSKEVHVHTLRQTYATHLLEDGMDIITLKDLWDIRTLNFCPNPIFMWFYFTR